MKIFLFFFLSITPCFNIYTRYEDYVVYIDCETYYHKLDSWGITGIYSIHFYCQMRNINNKKNIYICYTSSTL